MDWIKGRPSTEGHREKQQRRRGYSQYLSLSFSFQTTKYPIDSLRPNPDFPGPGHRITEHVTQKKCSQARNWDAFITLQFYEKRKEASKELSEKIQTLWLNRGGPFLDPSNTILRAPPICLRDTLRLRGGNFLGSGPSAPDLGGADWPSQANTF